MFDSNILAAVFVLAFIVILVQAFTTLARTFRTGVGRNWFLLSVFASLWILVSWRVVVYPESLNVWHYFFYNLFVVGIAVSYLRFVLNFLDLDWKKHLPVKIIYTVSFILIIFDFICLGYGYTPLSLYPVTKWGHFNYFTIALLVYFVGSFAYFFYLLVKNYNEFSDIIKRKIKYIATATLLGVLGGVLVYLPVLRGYDYVGICVLILAFLAGAYAIIKHPLAGLREIVSGLYFYAILSIFVYLFYFLSVYIATAYLGGIFTFKALSLGIFESIVFALIFLSLAKFIQETSEVVFYGGSKPGKVIKDLALKINEEREFDSLFRIIRTEFKNVLGVSEVKILVMEAEGSNKISDEYTSGDLNIKANSPLLKLENLFVVGATKKAKRDERVEKELRERDLKVAVPMKVNGKLIGALFLGKKIMDKPYIEEDFDFLKIIGAHAGIAIHNAVLGEELQSCNDDLRKEIKQKISDIEKKNERLKKLLRSQSEFLDIASHQLRTPMSVIKGMLSMMQEKDLSEKRKKEFLNSITQNAFRLEEIIETILTASELDSGSFGFELGPVQLKPLLEQISEREKMRARKKNLKFKLDMPKKYLLPVLSHESYLKQVIESLIDNAFQYTQEGGVTVRLIDKQTKINIEIKDTGIGIPEDETDKVFDKFSRCKNAVDTYGNGSGLGLYVVRKIIEDYHKNAKVFVKESKKGKGTAIVVSLPVVKNG